MQDSIGSNYIGFDPSDGISLDQGNVIVGAKDSGIYVTGQAPFPAEIDIKFRSRLAEQG
jgi:hypothetical protein